MLGYMNKKDAVKNGFTNHGKIYGVPVWVQDSEGHLLAAKWAPMELFISLFTAMDFFLHDTIWADREHLFTIEIGDSIE